MSITKFDTAVAPAGSGKGSNTLLIVIAVVVAGYLVYKFVIKPAQDKKKEDNKE